MIKDLKLHASTLNSSEKLYKYQNLCLIPLRPWKSFLVSFENTLEISQHLLWVGYWSCLNLKNIMKSDDPNCTFIICVFPTFYKKNCHKKYSMHSWHLWHSNFDYLNTFHTVERYCCLILSWHLTINLFRLKFQT